MNLHLEGQTAPAVTNAVAFEVASVKLNLNDVPEGISLKPNGGVRFTGFRLRTLISMAYGSPTIGRFDQFIGGPHGSPPIASASSPRRMATSRLMRVAVDDFQIEYSPALADAAGPAADAGPSLFTALKEQLGLTLRPEKAALPVIVIESRRAPDSRLNGGTMSFP